jgi:hypothetical protein
MFRFNEYRAAVLRDYEQRRKAVNQLSLELIYPTPTNLKEEAIKVCQKRFKKSDEDVLISFFKHQPNVSEYVSTIEKSDPDCFKPICNFLKGKTTNPEERQIELFAWLTDFEPRPYQEYLKTYPTPIEDAGTEPTNTEPPDTGGHKGPGTKGASSGEKETTRDKVTYPNYLILLSVLLLLATVVFVIYRYTTKPQCMRWNGERYEAVVACGDFPGDASVIPYDPVKLDHFKMISRYDTLTAYSLGKVWCIKRKEECEFFTSDGVHPVYRDLQLKPLTDYILNTVVRQKREQILLSSGKKR